MNRMLSVATAGLHAGQLADTNHLQFPRVDYIELQRMLDAETIDYSAYDGHRAGKLLRYLETQIRSDIYLATLSWWKSRQYPLVFTWSERAGIPLAGYKRLFPSSNRFVSMFQCWSERQELAMTSLKLFKVMDKIIVHCSSMKQNLVKLGAPKDKVEIIPYSIDQCFFSPLSGIEQQKDLIMSVGEPRSRNYAALFQAVDGLPVILKVPAYGHWYAREKNNTIKASIPNNVSMIRHLSHIELRDLYARSQFVVAPICDLIYSAGATTTLEASCMARPVIAFRSRGITDFIIDGETGILVEPDNMNGMREAIKYLLSNPKEVQRMGQNARQRILDELNFETYVERIAGLLSMR